MEVRFSGVTKSYRPEGRSPTLVLQDVSCVIGDGEFVAVVGPSGCGKSTMLGLMAGLTHPDSGTVDFWGERAPESPLTTVVWQEYSLIPWRNVVSNVGFGLELRKVDKQRREEISMGALDRMGIADVARSAPHQLSGGMRQRVAIARALANDPEVLLMDEPFAAVDAQTRVLLQEELLKVWELDKKTVLFITHNIEEAIFLADRVLVMGARPSGIVAEVVVPFDRPRTREVETAPEFIELREEIWHVLRDASTGGSGGSPA